MQQGTSAAVQAAIHLPAPRSPPQLVPKRQERERGARGAPTGCGGSGGGGRPARRCRDPRAPPAANGCTGHAAERIGARRAAAQTLASPCSQRSAAPALGATRTSSRHARFDPEGSIERQKRALDLHAAAVYRRCHRLQQPRRPFSSIGDPLECQTCPTCRSPPPAQCKSATLACRRSLVRTLPCPTPRTAAASCQRARPPGAAPACALPAHCMPRRRRRLEQRQWRHAATGQLSAASPTCLQVGPLLFAQRSGWTPSACWRRRW